MDQPNNTIETAVSAVASKVTYAGSGGTILGWLASSEASVVIGIGVAVVGLVVNIVFKIREDKRQQEEHDERMAHLRDGASHE